MQQRYARVKKPNKVDQNISKYHACIDHKRGWLSISRRQRRG